MKRNPSFAPNMYILAANLLKATSYFKKNTVVSPIPLVESLASLSVASCGETQASILKVLGYSSADELQASFLPALDTQEFYSASCLWLKTNGSLPDFVKEELRRDVSSFGTDVRSIPPKGLGQVSLDDYVQKASAGRMGSCAFAKEIAKSDAALLNLAGFYDCWASPIKKIESEIFHGLTSDSSVDMLTAKDGGLIYRGPEAAYLRKRYLNSRYSFVAIEPYDFKSFTKSFSSKDIEEALDFLWSGQAQVATVGIPRFSFQSETDLTLPLKAFGLSPMFDSTQGILQEILPQTSVSRVCQATSFYVDQFGTEAKSTQLTEARVGALPNKSRPVEPVILNHPFIYFIYDEETEVPLFTGTMVDFKESKTLEVSSESLDGVENAPKSEAAKTNRTMMLIGLVVLSIVLFAFVANPLGIIMIPMLLVVFCVLAFIMRFVQIGQAAVETAKSLVDKVIENKSSLEEKEAKQEEEFYAQNLRLEDGSFAASGDNTVEHRGAHFADKMK